MSRVDRTTLDHELRTVLMLVLPAAQSGAVSHDSNQEAADRFLAHLREQKLTINLGVAIREGSEIRSGCLGIISPGRTALVLPPHPAAVRAGPGFQHASVQALRELERSASQEDVVMLQALIPKHDTVIATILAQAGYRHLADLRYLALSLKGTDVQPWQESGLQVQTYAATGRAEFQKVLEQTYLQSLDCPALNGLRSTEDIMLSHEHTGRHDPKLWFLARREGSAIGVLLLTHVPLHHALEIVYIGVVPQARGRGYGRSLIQLAVEQARRCAKRYVMLAVDVRNHYAMEIYKTLGFNETDQRDAWFLPL